MSETCQDLERQSLNELVFLTYLPFPVQYPDRLMNETKSRYSLQNKDLWK